MQTLKIDLATKPGFKLHITSLRPVSLIYSLIIHPPPSLKSSLSLCYLSYYHQLVKSQAHNVIFLFLADLLLSSLCTSNLYVL